MNQPDKPWNVWRGMTEGDMLVELAEYEQHTSGLEYKAAFAYWSYQPSETIRRVWWETIGRHNDD